MQDDFSGRDAHVKKDVALEALRGLAAFVVVGWHLLLGYAPGRVPVFPGQDTRLSILGAPWFGLVYGTSSVTFFFVLSGFVLSRKALLRADPMILARGAVKRWPRLAGPVVLAVLFSWLMFVTHGYNYEAAGALTHSSWLATFATGVPAGSEFKPNLLKAINQGASLTFLKGGASYDTSLWTMHIEFIGSFIVFGLAAIMIALRDAKKIVKAWMLIVAILVCGYAQPFMACFAVGVTLAVVLGNKVREIPLAAGIVLAVFAMWLMSYYPNAGIYLWLALHLHHAPPDTYVHTIGAVTAIFVIEATPKLRRIFSGRISVVLGKLSFPVYLLHVPVLCSAGAAVFLATQGVLPGVGPKLAAGATTVVVTMLLAWPLALFDGWWVRKIGGVTDRLVHSPLPVGEVDRRSGEGLLPDSAAEPLTRSPRAGVRPLPRER